MLAGYTFAFALNRSAWNKYPAGQYAQCSDSAVETGKDLLGSRLVEYIEDSSHLRKVAINFYKSNANITNAFPY